VQGTSYSLYRSIVLALLFLIADISWSGGNTTETLDLTRPPDYKQLGIIAGKEKLSLLRDTLGDALTSHWKDSRSGRPGSSSNAAFAKWVDLYQWLDLLESNENEVMKHWLSRHLSMTAQQSGLDRSMHITIIQPGIAPGHGSGSPELLDKIVSDDAVMQKIVAKLVAQPFTPAAGLLADRLDPNFISATLADPDFLQRWSESYSQDDVAPKVLLNFQAIWKSHSADWHEFQSLALALAVVKDQPAPDFWPHHQVAQVDVPREEGQPEELFSQWVEAFRAGKLRMDPRLLEVEDLKFVVDAPLKESEIDSIRENPQLAHLDPQKAFESIPYDQGRVIKNVYDWPWGEYLLADIRMHGGICVDQAYYAAIVGKALGIPTIFFSGQGKDGGHAWVGYLKGPGHWELNVARYASQNYATGEGLDPQDWSPITDHDLELITRHLGNPDFQNAARRDLIIGSVFRRKGDLAGEGRALQSALQVSPENPSLWDAREEWLIRTGAPVADLKAHHQAAIAQFSRFSDLKAQHQEALIALAVSSGDKKNAEELSDQIVHENRGGWNRDARTDLSSQAAWSLISDRLQTKDFAAAVEEFERQLHLLGETGGGNFYYKVVAPLASGLISAGRQDLALRVLKEACQTIRPTYDSILDRDLRKLWAVAGGAPSKPASSPR
jgi:tetratricopeptide (TPR) repeat protein